jgi:hypothetical protein
VRRRSQSNDDTEAGSVEPDEMVAVPLQVSGPDIFVSVRAPRRERRPAPLRKGRHAGRDARRAAALAAARANHPCHGTSRMYLIDGEGEYEENRIAIRARFEAIPGVDAVPGAHESAAG